MTPHQERGDAKKQFDAWAGTYDNGWFGPYFARSHRFVLSVAQHYLPDDARILDLGSGTGSMLGDLCRLKPDSRVVGLDISSKMMKLAGDKLRNRRASADLMLGDAYHLPFADSSYDAVLCLNAFHHLHGSLGEVLRVLRTNGLLVLLDNHNDGPVRTGWIKIMTAALREKGVRFYTKSGMARTLADQGLVVLEQKEFLYFVLLTVCRKGDGDQPR